jgi:hypothetical protein
LGDFDRRRRLLQAAGKIEAVQQVGAETLLDQ